MRQTIIDKCIKMELKNNNITIKQYMADIAVVKQIVDDFADEVTNEEYEILRQAVEILYRCEHKVK